MGSTRSKNSQNLKKITGKKNSMVNLAEFKDLEKLRKMKKSKKLGSKTPAFSKSMKQVNVASPRKMPKKVI